MEERYTSKIVVDLLLQRKNPETGEKQVLLSLRKNTGYKDNQYELPGGYVEKDEDLLQAMIREAKEELNIDIHIEDLKIEHILHHYKGNRIKFVISAKKYNGDLKIMEKDQCADLHWFDIDKFPENIDERVKKVITEINNDVFYDNSDFINLI